MVGALFKGASASSYLVPRSVLTNQSGILGKTKTAKNPNQGESVAKTISGWKFLHEKFKFRGRSKTRKFIRN